MEHSSSGDDNTNSSGKAVMPELGTRVDFGEDLLEITKLGVNPSKEARPQEKDEAPLGVDEDLSNGEILFNEQIFSEAKKIFRRILRKDPDNIRAKEFLTQIQNKEIQELLSSDNRGYQKLGSGVEVSESFSDVIESLEKDLRLNFLKNEAKPVPDLFADNAAEATYVHKLMQSIEKLQPRDMMDVGIAYIEMGIFSAARAVFEELIKHDEYKISGMYLLCTALICSDQCVEATIRLEPLVRDLSMPEAQKADFLYMMGLAFEKLGEKIKSKEFYRRVFLLNPRYRDVVDKIR